MRSLRLTSLIIASLVGPAEASAQDATSSEKFRGPFSKYFETCMQDWDAASHMTKEDCGRTCRRLAEERVRFRLEHSKEFNPQKE
jgi:phage terminase large subunit-like protein